MLLVEYLISYDVAVPVFASSPEDVQDNEQELDVQEDTDKLVIADGAVVSGGADDNVVALTDDD